MQIFTNQRIAIRPQSNSRLLEKAPCKKAPKSPRRQHAFRSESSGSAKNRSDLDRTSRGTFGLNTLKNARKSSFWTSSGRTWHLDRDPWTSTEDELALPLLSLFCVLVPGDRQALQCAPCAFLVVSMTTKHAQKALKWMKSSEQLTVSVQEQSERGALRSVIHPDASHSTSVE